MRKTQKGFLSNRAFDRCGNHPDYCRNRYPQPAPRQDGSQRSVRGRVDPYDQHGFGRVFDDLRRVSYQPAGFGRTCRRHRGCNFGGTD